MHARALVLRSLIHYRALNAAVVLGVATAVAVLSGALIVGDSVRASLRDLFLSRIGQTDYVISSPGFFREALANDLVSDTGFQSQLRAASPVIAIEGLLTHERSGARHSRVQVFGVDESFWRLHEIALGVVPLEGRDALLSRNLADELGALAGDTLLLRVEFPSAIPSGWLHGDRNDPGRTIRLAVKDRMPASLPVFSLRPTQAEVFSIVVPLARLQQDLDRRGKVNTILVRGTTHPSSPTADSADLGLKALLGAFDRTHALADIGLALHLRPRPDDGTGALDGANLSLESDALLLDSPVSDAAREVAAAHGLRTMPVFTYLATMIRARDRAIPYSLVTALDLDALPPPRETSEGAMTSGEPPIVLNEWAASDLGVKPGDPIEIEYYVWREHGGLETRTATFRFARSVPIQGLAADRALAPVYPGITDSPSFSDWDPPFPIDLKRVRKQDEAYWESYRTTPKAFIGFDEGRRLWGSRYGNLTAVRFTADGSQDLSRLATDLAERLRLRLAPRNLGVRINPVRSEGLSASEGATDFGEYFTYFSFFLVVAALLLAALFFKLGVEQRLQQLGLLRALGFPPSAVRRLFLGEGLLLALLGAVIGMAGAVSYGWLVMLGLKTWWVDAVGTTALALHLRPASIVMGAVGGMLAAAAAIAWTLRSVAKTSPRSLLAGSAGEAAVGGDAASHPRRRLETLRPPRVARLGLITCLPIALLALGLATAGAVSEVAGFFAGGSAMLLAALCAFALWLQTPGTEPLTGRGWRAVSRVGIRNAAVRSGRSTVCVALVAAATFILVSVDAFRIEDPDGLLAPDSGTGGFAMMAEALVPLHHDPGTPQGLEALNLTGPDDSSLRWSAFRAKPGDDASCLNLYVPLEPRILAPGDAFIRAGRFRFAASLATTPEEQRNPWLLLARPIPSGAVPVIADSNSVQYVLHRKLGDEMTLQGESGPYTVKIVATLDRSLFQSELLMAEQHFVRLFPAYEGFRYFLIDADPGLAPATVPAVENRLRDFAVDVTPAADRLAEFRRVENTYLTTFQMLGGLGLMLGSLGLATVLVRNVLERRRELALLRAVGYRRAHLALMVISENAVLLLGGVTAGALSAALAIVPALISRGGDASPMLPLLIAAVLASGFTASLVATLAAFRSPLLPALRAE